MERPIDDDEVKNISVSMDIMVRPDQFYYLETKREEYRFRKETRSLPRPPMFAAMFWGLNGSRRIGVIIRHNFKRRWEKLGVWNPKWGFAGRQVWTDDDHLMWIWWWQAASVEANQSSAHKAWSEPYVRALRLRRELQSDLIARAVRLRQTRK
jgi:hypothetical protein